MSDQSADITLVYLRRLGAKMDKLAEDMREVRHRLTTLATQVAGLVSTASSHYASLSMRMDRLEDRIDRIEPRLDIVTA